MTGERVNLLRAAIPADATLNRGNGFTLIELLAVLLLLALLTTAVSVSLASAAGNVGMRDVVAQVLHYDLLARHDARQRGEPLALVMSLADSKLMRRTDRRPAGSDLVLPPGYSIAQVRLPHKRISYGNASIPVSSRGHTPAYAVRIDGPREQSQWLLFAGLSGQPVMPGNDHEVDRIFQSLAGGPDAR